MDTFFDLSYAKVHFTHYQWQVWNMLLNVFDIYGESKAEEEGEGKFPLCKMWW